MTAFSGTGYRYRIVLSGECGSLVAALFADVTIESARGRTCVTACVQDDSELYGLIHRFEDLALHLISLGELDPPAPVPSPRAGDVAAAGVHLT
jgi:hypothetical protein